MNISQTTEEFRDLNERAKEAQKKLESYLAPLIKTRKTMEEKISTIESELRPHKEALSQIDAEIESILRSAEIDEYKAEGKKFIISREISGKTIDIKSLVDWAHKDGGTIEIKNTKGQMETYHKANLFLANLVSKREITKLFDSGVVPPGVRIDTFQRFKVNKG